MNSSNSTPQPGEGGEREPESGYDIPVYGIANGTFYYIHVPAMICIVSSFCCAVTAIVLSFRARGWRSFFRSWSKSERFVVYLAICDGLFNVSHFTDHLHIAIVQDMVYPKELCEFYGFNLAIFITSQNLMVNVVAINAFCLIFFNKNINFGRKDWRLLAWTFGAPFFGAAIAGIAGQLGPNGSFCYFDAIKGKVANIFFTTIPLFGVLILNSILYTLTWWQIHKQTRAVKESFGTMSASMRASHRAARAMSLFVAAFFIQWWAMALYGAWGFATDDPPQPLFHMVTTFSNLGGDLNLAVYFIIRRRNLLKGEKISTMERSLDRSSDVKRSKHSHNSHVSLTEITKENNDSVCESPKFGNTLEPKAYAGVHKM